MKDDSSTAGAVSAGTGSDEVLQYTPWPWSVMRSDDGHIAIVSAEPDLIAVVEPGAKAIANARLLAAAPELLEALQKCRSALDTLMGDSDIEGDDSPEMQAMQAASAAITKAKGG